MVERPAGDRGSPAGALDRVPPAVLVAGIGATIYVLLLAAGRKLLNDGDTYWHLAVGRRILEDGFPTVDPFSFTALDDPWIAKEWLSQVAYVLAERIGGWTGTVVLAAAAAAVAVAIVARFLARHLRPPAVVLLSLTSFLLLAAHLLARPHALALPLVAAWSAGLVRATDERRAPSWWLLGLLVLWANVHSSFIIGLALAAALALDALAAAEPAERRRTALAWVRFGLLAGLATFVTPYGPGSLLAALRVLGLGDALSIIGEWQPADFSELPPIELALLAGLALALLRGVVLPPIRIALLLGLLHLALSATRNADVFGLVAPLLLAAPLARCRPGLAADQESAGRTLARSAGIAAAVLVPVTLAIGLATDLAPARRVTPAAAVDAALAAGAERIFNDYNLGGYLVHAGVPTFIDGRTELFDPDFVLAHHRAVTLADLDGLLALLDDHDVDATLLVPGAPAVAFLDRSPDWQRVHADDVAVVHVRR